MHDLLFALRTLRRNRGFTLAVISVLGAGIGAATVVFIVADRVLIAPLPYRDPQRLVRVNQQYSPTAWGTISAVDIQAIGEQQKVFEAFGAVRPSEASLAAGRQAQRVVIGRATSGFFAALGVRPAYGRLLERRDDRPGAAVVAVVSHALADRIFGSAERAVGQSIMLDGASVDIVGVLEAGRDELAGLHAEMWPVLQLGPQPRRGPFGYRGVARLKNGVTVEEASRDLAAISDRIFPVWKSSFQDAKAKLVAVSLQDAIVGTAYRQVGLFAGAVALVLLLGIANVGTLMFVRAMTREHELAVRTALGAARHRLARLIFTECLLLTGLAGVAAIAVAAFGLKLVRFVAPDLPRLAEVTFDPVALAFTVALVAISGTLVSVAPLTFAFRAAATATVSGSAGRSGPGRHASLMRAGIVVGEFALALPLLIGAGLLLNSFVRLQRVDVGFDADDVYGIRVSLAADGDRDANAEQAFWRQLEARAGEISGVTAAGLSSSLPPDTHGDVNNFDLLDHPVAPGSNQPTAPWISVSPGFFSVVHLRLLEGRSFTLADTQSAPPVVVVSRSWAATYFPGQSAIGKQLRSGGCTTCDPTTIVGVVGDVHYRGLTEAKDAVYVPLSQAPSSSLNLMVRSRLGRAATLRLLRAELAALDPQTAAVDVVMTERFAEALGNPRRWASVVGSFAAAGVVLAAVGVFGLMSAIVRQRRRELGVRLALGATPRSMVRLVVQRGMRYAVAGTVIGLAISTIESRWLGSLLFGVRPVDPATIALSVLALVVVAVIACAVPGTRAARISPVDALREV
jgi:putative ABC transport system permease protein